MSDTPTMQEYVHQLRKSWDGLVLLEQNPAKTADETVLDRSLQSASHNAVLASAHGLAQLQYPGASQFLRAYSNLVGEFLVPVGQAGDMEGWRLEFVDEGRATNLRPVALYMLASFLTQLSRDTTELMPTGAIVGGPDRNPPLPAFLNLVRIVHARSEGIREVIVTDPYVLADKGEDNVTGGYDNTIAYLNAVGLKCDHNFVLKITPAPRKATPSAAGIFERCITAAFPKATVTRFSPTYIFHDRLYITRDSRGQLNGVFGPSLNGLNSLSIVIMGAIDAKGLAWLSRCRL